jgi:hypothetical protein
MRIAWVVGVGAIALAACSDDDDAPAFQCRMGELTGTWRVSYRETNGSCGPVSEETVVLESQTNQGAAAACTYGANKPSPDKCTLSLDYTCPLNGVQGTQQWIGQLRQTAANRLEGSFSVQVQGSPGVCRSTYDVTWTQL